MPEVDDLLNQIRGLDSSDQLKLAARWVAENLGGLQAARSAVGIETAPGVCGGEPRVVRTRIPVWVLEQMRRMGVSDGEILRSYPTLRAEDLVNAWAYADLHRDEVNREIRENEEA
ncbi:MAG: DUF433 domain-containing protein [Planctomycetia bacterium]|nr:DUF433 domain-containing protein [Planctomycetia bacterium]